MIHTSLDVNQDSIPSTALALCAARIAWQLHGRREEDTIKVYMG